MLTWLDVNHFAPDLKTPIQPEQWQLKLIESAVKERHESGLLAVLCPSEPDLQYNVDLKTGCFLQREIENGEVMAAR